MKPEREAGMQADFERVVEECGIGACSMEYRLTFYKGYRAGEEAQRERDAQLVEPDDFEAGSSEWCALRSVQNAIRSAPIGGEK